MSRWSGPYLWPLIAVHMALLPNGKVLIADYYQESANPLNNPKVWVWDPNRPNFVENVSAWGTQVPNTNNNVFCAGHSGLADGRIFWAGGHIVNFVGTNKTDFWNPVTNQWQVGPQMTYARWYPTCTTLPDGNVYISSGYITNGNLANVPELYDPIANTIKVLPSAYNVVPDYPFNFVAPNGKLFYAGPEVDTQYLDIKTWQWMSLTYTSPFAGLYNGSAVMYDVGKILKTGGSLNNDGPAVSSAATIYLNPNTTHPQPWTAVPNMAYARFHHNLTMLPDGTVLCTGGNRMYKDDNGGSRNAEPVMYAEIFTPGPGTTGTWTTVPEPMTVPRWYHSVAMLLPNAKVIVAGGNYKQNAEVFTPPYLDNVTEEMRPKILGAPEKLIYGQTVQIQTDPGAGTLHNKASLIRLGAVTHAFDQNQRFMWLNFNPSNGALTAPANANIAPPGYYMLFVLTSIKGKLVPSVAKFVKVGPRFDRIFPFIDF